MVASERSAPAALALSTRSNPPRRAASAREVSPGRSARERGAGGGHSNADACDLLLAIERLALRALARAR
jgi:hypothetical protein